MAANTPLDIVGALEIVTRAHTEHGATLLPDTVRSWEKRRRAWVSAGRPVRSSTRPREEPMPDPIGPVNGQPAWKWSEVLPWMIRSGKIQVSAE